MRASVFTLGFFLLTTTACADPPEVAWPISGDPDPDADRVTSPFGPRDQGGSYDFHAGVDFPVAKGTKVRAIKAGTVEKITEHDGGTGPGNWVLIDHGDGEKSSYLHLSKISTRAGASVVAGEVIGRSGSTGASSAHLHLTYMVGVTSKGADETLARNPLELLPHGDPPAPSFEDLVDAGSGELSVLVELDAQVMTVHSIVVEGAGVARVVDYAEILNLGNPARDEQLQSGVWLHAGDVTSEGRFTLTLRGDGFEIERVELYDYDSELIAASSPS